MTANKRRPAIFNPEDGNLRITSKEELFIKETALPNTIDPQATGKSDLSPKVISASVKKPPRTKSRLLTWGGVLITSLIGLITLWASTSILQGIASLFARNDALGWLAVTLATAALLSLLALISREIYAIMKLKKLAILNAEGRQIYEDNKLKPARKYLARIKDLYEEDPSRSWHLGRIKSSEHVIMDGREILELIDTELGAPLDKEARAIISASAKKVSLITAIAPGPILDMAAVAVLNIHMIRKIAEVYGVRPGLFGQLRLARNVIAHLALSGGIAVTSDLLSPLIGTSIAAKLSKRLGEGLFNGALTIRIGLSAIELTRPIPYLSTKRLSFAALVSSSLSPLGEKKASNNKDDK